MNIQNNVLPGCSGRNALTKEWDACMTTSTIYTIEREFGSGGHIVGEKLAKLLGIPFYDSQIVDMAAKNAGVSRKIFEGFDEKPTNSFLYSLVMGSYTAAGKTGSAEYSNNKGESHAWFTGYAENEESGKIVVTVIVEGGGSGRERAVPIAKAVFDKYFN